MAVTTADRGSRGILFCYLPPDEDCAGSLMVNFEKNGIQSWVDRSLVDTGDKLRQHFREQLSASWGCIFVLSRHYDATTGPAFLQRLELAAQQLGEDPRFRLAVVRVEECGNAHLPTPLGSGLTEPFDLFDAEAEDALIRLLTMLGATRPTIHPAPVPEIRVRRLDYQRHPVELIADGKEICRIRSNDELLIHLPARSLHIYARCYYEYSQRASYSSYDEYHFGRSKKVFAALRPFGKYIISVNASNLHSYTFSLLSPFTLLGRKLLGFERKIWYSDEDTWDPTITLQFRLGETK